MAGAEVMGGTSCGNTPRNAKMRKWLCINVMRGLWVCANASVGVRHAHRWGLGKGCLGLRHAHTSGKGVPYLQARHAHASSVAVVFRASKPQKVAFFVCGNISFEKVCCQDKYMKKSPARSCVPCGGFLYVVPFRGYPVCSGKGHLAVSFSHFSRGSRTRAAGSASRVSSLMSLPMPLRMGKW